MSEALFDPDLQAMTDEFFADTAESTRTAVGEATPDAGPWARLTALGLTGIGIPAAAGGSDGSLGDLLTVLSSAARTGTPLPLTENFLAGWLLAEAGLPRPDGPATIALPPPTGTLHLREGRLHGTAEVPWSAWAEVAVALATGADGDPHVVTFRPETTVRAGRDLTGAPTAFLAGTTEPTAVTAVGVGPADLVQLGALCRTAQIAGALDGALTLSIRYARDRVQFGKPISTFQAVQAQLVGVAQAAETAGMALALAARSAVSGSPRRSFDVAAAKLVANESARAGARAAHQVHGAMGMTREYPLLHFTRPLHRWRRQFGSDKPLADAVGRAVAGTPSLLPVVTDAALPLEVAWPM